MSGQSINDRITAARLSIAGQGLAKSVCKSTTEEVIGPKKKHLDYLLHCTNEPNVSIPQLANFLIERTNHTNWVVVFKALITVHHLMCYGNERFTQYLASSNCNFQLGGFLDKTGVQGYDMSTYIRRYAKYLNDKAMSYRTVAFDFCKVKRGKDDGILRTMNIEKLLKTVPVLQNQIDSLLEFDCTANELTNGVINTAFMLLFRDLIRLFACYNDGIINLLEKYFDMNKKMCREALDIYKKFLIRMDRVAEFLKVAESVGIDKGDIPDLTKAPSSLLDALEQHLATLEGRKGGATTPTQSTASGRHSSVKNAVLALSNTSNAFGTAAAASAGRQPGGINGEDEVLKKLAIEEEEAILEQLKDRRLKELESSDGSSGSTTNPFLASPGASDANNLFGSPPNSTPASAPSGKAFDDLLCLANSNPFAATLASKPSNASPMNNFWGDQNGFSSTASSTSFVPETSFNAVFGASPATPQAVGTVQTGGAYLSEGGASAGRDKGCCDLTIPGLNPFAAVSSATPSPSIPFEFGGPGTTPILGGSEGQTFGFGDFNVASESQVSGGSGGEAAGAFVSEGLTPFVDGAARPRPASPATGTQAPKPTPATSPAPPPLSAATQLDAFDDFSFGSKPPEAAASGAAGAGNLFDFAGAAVGGGAKTAGINSAMDDLNAAIHAALNKSSPATKISPETSATSGLSTANSQLGFESPSKIAASGFDAFGDILMPVSSNAVTSSTTTISQPKQQSKVMTGDLDSSLASLVQNLDINRSAGAMQKSGSMWNSPKNTAKTGGANWTPQVASSTGPTWNSPQHTPYQPMGQTAVTGKPADWSSGLMAGHFPQGGSQGGTSAPFVSNAVPTQQGFPRGFVGTMGPATGLQQQRFPQPTQPQQPTLDPFGAL